MSDQKTITDWKFSTKAVHVGSEPDAEYGAVVPAIYATSTYRQSAPGEYRERYDYGRTAQPTRTAYERCIASLEGGAEAITFASGLSAISAVLDLLPVGSHVIACEDLYGGTARMFARIRSQTSNLKVSFVDLNDRAALSAAITPETKLLWIETPTNPMLKIYDIEFLASFAKENNLLAVVDNTFASPYLQQPLKYGVDLVLHSATKYISGHSDLVNGVIVCREKGELLDRLRFLQFAVGAVPSAFDCFLAHRGVKTLALRMSTQCQTAFAVAEFLVKHKRINKVYYPGLESHPQHALAKKQMLAFGGMISFDINGDLEFAKNFLKKLQVFTLAESLGAVESLIEHPALMTHMSLSPEHRAKLGITDGFIRISCGIEDKQDLIDDLSQALA